MTTGLTPASDLIDLLSFEATSAADTFVSTRSANEGLRLYGGTTAALAVRAASATLPTDFLPHSVQCSYVNAGIDDQPITLIVERDRDGRSFATRRVTALQGESLLTHTMISFQRREEGIDHQLDPAPGVSLDDTTPIAAVPRLLSVEGLLPRQETPLTDWPSRFWTRVAADFDHDDAGLQAALLVYVSDISTGLSSLVDGEWDYGPTLNHTVWLHRALPMQEWVLLDFVPRSTGGGRGWYTGTMTSESGMLGASLAQETLFRKGTRRSGAPLGPVLAAFAGQSVEAVATD